MDLHCGDVFMDANTLQQFEMEIQVRDIGFNKKKNCSSSCLVNPKHAIFYLFFKKKTIKKPLQNWKKMFLGFKTSTIAYMDFIPVHFLHAVFLQAQSIATIYQSKCGPGNPVSSSGFLLFLWSGSIYLFSPAAHRRPAPAGSPLSHLTAQPQLWARTPETHALLHSLHCLDCFDLFWQAPPWRLRKKN